MVLRLKIYLVIGFTLAALAGVAVVIQMVGLEVLRPAPATTLQGTVLTQNVDPSSRTPLPGVTVTATGGSTVATVTTDPAGYFSLTLNPGVKRGEAVTLSLKKPNFKSLEITSTTPGDQLYITQLPPVAAKPQVKLNQVKGPAKMTIIRDLRVRYSYKEEATTAVGSFAKEFVALNNGDVACRGQKPCSPDGKWKATLTTLPIEPEQGNEFRNVRVSCLAGPCHFTKIETAIPAGPVRQARIKVLNWSDTADFLVEADVIRIMSTEMVRQAYPFILGSTMNFTMPPTAEGPSVEAELDGENIVFPLGPGLILAWANCNVDASADGNKIYRCQLKPGYQFQ
jgi:hypothetical protein